MNLDKLIMQRRSKRTYLEKPVQLEKLGQILDIARYAPSAGNLQNWRFIIVTEPKIKSQIAEASLRQYWINQAPVLIVITGDIEQAKRTYPQKAESYTMQSCANASMLMMLKAEELNLSTAWVGSFDAKAVKRILRIPEQFQPYIILTLGYSNEKPFKKKMIPLSIITYFDKYGNKLKEFTKPLLKSKIKTLKNLIAGK